MSTVDASNIVIGGSATPDNNFKFEAPDNGTLTLKTAGGARTIMTVDANGNINAGVARSMVRLNTANGYGSTNTVIRRFTNVVTNQGSDITYADSATLGASFTINTNGVYAISYSDGFVSADYLGISLNSSQLTTGIHAITASDKLCISATSGANIAATASITLYLPSGSIIRPHATTTSGTGAVTANTNFTITRVG